MPKKVRWSSRWWWYPRRIKDAVWWFRWRFDPRHQYNVVKTGLKPGYYDIDTLLLHASMSLLCRYVEDERGGRDKLLERISQLREEEGKYYGPSHEPWINLEIEVLAIYDWWQDNKNYMDRVFINLDVEDAFYQTCNEMLKRVIDIRRGLWT